MSETTVDRLDRTLNRLLAASPGLTAAAVVSIDGLMTASALPPGPDEARIGAMSAALLTLGEQAVSGSGCSHLANGHHVGDAPHGRTPPPAVWG